jgi:DNA primase
MKDEAIKAFQYLVTKELPNIKEVVAAFDNDKQGIEYDEKLKNILLKSNPTIEMIKDKSTLKDWNEDLKSYKKSLHNSFNHARNYEKSFTLEMEK